MDWQALAAVAEIVASVAIVLSLVYLALQIRQSAQATRAATYQSVMTSVGTMSTAIIQSADAAEVIYRGGQDISSLSPPERVRFEQMASALFRHYDVLFYHHRHGLLEPEQWEGLNRRLQAGLVIPGLVRWWSENRIHFSRDFAKYVDGLKPPADGSTSSG
jgi:hypothetical protein